MSEEDNIEPNFDPAQFFAMLRKSASVKAGAIMFGEAQLAYYDTLRAGSLNDKQAFELLATTTEALIRGIVTVIPPLIDVTTRVWQIQQALEGSGKEVPGHDTPGG